MLRDVNFTPFHLLLYYFAKFIGLAPFSVRNNNLHPTGFLRKGYAVILVVLSSVWTFSMFVYRQSKATRFTSINNFAFTIHSTLYVGDACSSLLILAFKSNKIIEIMNRMAAIRDELKNLGIEESCFKYNKIFYVKIIASNSAVILFRVIVNVILHNGGHGMIFTALFWFGSILITMHSHNAILIFVEAITFLRRLFESLNNKLEGTVRTNYRIFSSHDQRNSPAIELVRRRRITAQTMHRIIIESENIHLSVGEVEKIAKLHEELSELVGSVTNLYTIPITFAILQHFSKLLTNFYALYTGIFLSHHTFESTDTLVPLVQQLVGRTSIMIVELLLIADACTSICKAGNATKTVLHRLWNRFHPGELKDEFFKFSLQLMQKPITVAAFGFFHLDYSYLYKIFCAVAAYFIIMIQLETSQAKPDT